MYLNPSLNQSLQSPFSKPRLSNHFSHKTGHSSLSCELAPPNHPPDYQIISAWCTQSALFMLWDHIYATASSPELELFFLYVFKGKGSFTQRWCENDTQSHRSEIKTENIVTYMTGQLSEVSDRTLAIDKVANIKYSFPLISVVPQQIHILL